uniref:Mitochondrial ribosomal protein S36 n=1 Tax=Apteryx owenii TaxID=8824 RepID=A0A8B9NWM7_APTOW
ISETFRFHTILQKNLKSEYSVKNVWESLQASVPSHHASKAQESVGGGSPAFQNISPVSRVQGAPDTSELARTLPQKYRRKLMSEEEIEYIQRGGPE